MLEHPEMIHSMISQFVETEKHLNINRSAERLSSDHLIFRIEFNRFWGTKRSRVRIGCFSEKLFRAFAKRIRLSIFFGNVRLFSKISHVCKGPPSIFLLFCNKLNFQIARSVSPFIFRRCETVLNFSLFG